MPRHHIIRKQRQRRQSGLVKRVEIVLDADNQDHHTIHDYLQSLPRGAAAEFIRQAIIEKIERETNAPAPESDAQPADPVEQLEAMIAALADESRRANAQLGAMIRHAMRQPVPVAAPDPPESPGPVVSSGIDMSRPRPRKHPPEAKPAAAPPPSDLPDELSEADQIRLAKIMAASIKRAQPGRMSG